VSRGCKRGEGGGGLKEGARKEVSRGWKRKGMKWSRTHQYLDY